MVNIMIVGSIREEHLEGIERQSIATVIIHGLAGRKSKDDHGLTRRHERASFGHRRPKRIKNEPLQRMVVECPKRIRHVKAMVDGVNVLVEEFVDMEETMPKVFPCIHHKPVETIHELIVQRPKTRHK